MKTTVILAALTLSLGGSMGAADILGAQGIQVSVPAFDLMSADSDIERRGRGRGRGGDSATNGGGGGGGGGHGGRPRIPGGSGCDDPEDLIEHPECRVGLR